MDYVPSRLRHLYSFQLIVCVHVAMSSLCLHASDSPPFIPMVGLNICCTIA